MSPVLTDWPARTLTAVIRLLVSKLRLRAVLARVSSPLAETDALTGAASRYRLERALQLECERARRFHQPFTVIAMDVDNFKQINDTYGHATGDLVLQTFGMILLGRLRGSDQVGRIGGEEFAVLLTETNLKVGESVAEKLRRCIDGEPLILDGGHTIFPSMSFGVGAPGARHFKDLFQQVDKALYQAKNRGRNCVVVVE